MIIKNNYFVLEIHNNKVIYNQNELKYNSYQNLYDILVKYLNRKKKDELKLDGEYEPLNNVEQLVILALSNFYSNLYSLKYDKKLDFSYSYNFPIFKQKWIIKEILEIGDEAFNSHMIVLADTDDYVVKNVSNKEEYNEFYKKYGYYIRRGDKFFKAKNCNLDYTLNYWNNYCLNKHKKYFNKEAIKVYSEIYSNLGFNSIKITFNNEIAATSVYFRDEKNKIIYYLITGWNEKYKKYSPCIYIYSKAIQYCHNNNYNFSFCYGLQNYKYQLLKYFKDNDS